MTSLQVHNESRTAPTPTLLNSYRASLAGPHVMGQNSPTMTASRSGSPHICALPNLNCPETSICGRRQHVSVCRASKSASPVANCSWCNCCNCCAFATPAWALSSRRVARATYCWHSSKRRPGLDGAAWAQAFFNAFFNVVAPHTTSALSEFSNVARAASNLVTFAAAFEIVCWSQRTFEGASAFLVS